MTYQGTSYFSSKRKYYSYMKSQEYDRQAAKQLLEEGCFHIGKPPSEKGQSIIENDEGRYVIKD